MRRRFETYSKRSNYVIETDKKKNNIIEKETEISNINDYAFYKLTSFGYSFIGYGLDERIIKKIKLSNKNLNKELLSKYGIIYKKSSFKF
jgi:predicted glycosyltransferase involved in capsule biosynthesis